MTHLAMAVDSATIAHMFTQMLSVVGHIVMQPFDCHELGKP